ncbi:hypothetical protein NERG_00545 [Nematocida ausubeli]|uniref:Homeobox domain-containing protein n=1 Tax=Nematocida ausubeli (strain ATCC PRA-371 / ERTm2) TaxID=1913371 RepID=H8ZAC4_NEMA1|nr:hypothetical protein NERG_00545 [Nematocida ausubeli]
MTSNRPVKFIDFTEEIMKSFERKAAPKKPRIKLDLWQIKSLEKAFEDDSHPSQKAKTKLSALLGITIKSIQIWFQNKRAKEKTKRDQSETESDSTPFTSEQEVFPPHENIPLPAEPEKKVTAQKYEENHFRLSNAPTPFDMSDISDLTMTYDISQINDSFSFDHQQNTTYSEYDSFLSSFSAPLCMPEEKPEAARQTYLSSQNGVFDQTPLFSTLNQQKCHLTNGNLTYTTDLERLDFFNELQHHMTNSII